MSVVHTLDGVSALRHSLQEEAFAWAKFEVMRTHVPRLPHKPGVTIPLKEFIVDL